MKRSELEKHNASDLKNVLSYDEDSGLITWAISANLGFSVGDVAGFIHHTGYRVISYKSRKYLAHRIAWLLHTGDWPSMHIDHINGDKLDNKISNLRDVSRSINAQNLIRPHKSNSSGYLGVVARRNKWIAVISKQGKQIYLGTFAEPELAHAAYLSAKITIHAGAQP